MSKRKSLQPWLEYFDMLHTYEQKGYLEMKPEKHEAYITRAALYTLFPAPALPEGEGRVAWNVRNGRATLDTALRIRGYAGWRQQEGPGYMAEPFAPPVVGEDSPHDLLCTILLTQKRRWRRLWRKTDSVEVITYNRHEKQQ